MSELFIKPSTLSGTITAPPSKSQAHRLIIASALAKGASVIENVDADAADVSATIAAVRALGAKVKLSKNTLTVKGGRFKRHADVFCKESGTTLRLLMPVAAAAHVRTTFYGEGGLGSRPYENLAAEMIKNGAELTATGGLPVTVAGNMSSGKYEIWGNVSSQMISGLLFALPLFRDDSELCVLGRRESEGYIEMTLDTLSKFGVSAEATKNGYYIPGSQRYKPQHISVEGDYSGAAFYLAAAAINGNSITVNGLSVDSLQGDREMLKLLKGFGANVEQGENYVTVTGSETPLKARHIDVSKIPDLAPILAVIMARADGTSRITGAARLKLKECDRFAAIDDLLSKINVKHSVGDDFFEICGNNGAAFDIKTTIETFSDHRMAMAGAIAASVSNAGGAITCPKSVAKSYPAFFYDFKSLGGLTSQ